jgi:hypothetical protein
MPTYFVSSVVSATFEGALQGCVPMREIPDQSLMAPPRQRGDAHDGFRQDSCGAGYGEEFHVCEPEREHVALAEEL